MPFERDPRIDKGLPPLAAPTVTPPERQIIPTVTLNPPAPQQPQGQVVDRVAWNQHQLERIRQAQAQIAAARAMFAPVQRIGQRYLDEQAVRGQQFDPTGMPIEQPRHVPIPEEPVNSGLGPLKSVYNALRTDVPYMDRVQNAVRTAPGRAGGAIGGAIDTGIEAITPRRLNETSTERVQRAQQANNGEFAQLGETLGGGLGEVGATFVPQEVWDTALTLLPAAKARTPAELLAALTIGDVDAVRAVKQAGAKLGESAKVEGALRALAGGERGALGPFGRKDVYFDRYGRRAQGAVEWDGVQNVKAPEMFFHGTSARDALEMFENGFRGTIGGPPEIYVSDAVYMALGQGGRGAIVEIPAEGLDRARIVRPVGQSPEMAQELGTNWRVNPRQSRVVESVTISPVALKEDRVTRLRIKSLERAGRIGVERLPDGGVRITKPGALRALASERGALEPEKFVPENVITALKNRNRAVAKNPDELQAAWDVLPPVNQKMITHLADAVLTPAERQAVTKAGRARQTARAREAITETAGTTLERARAGRAALKGRIIPQIKPVGPAFDEQEVTSLFSQIDDAFDARTILPQEHGTATDALHLLLYGERPLDPDKPLSLMPHEIKLLGRIFGPEFEAVLPKSKAQLSLFDKIIDYANLPRAIISGIDVSAPGRQGIVLAARNPVEWGKAWGPMVKAMLSEQRYTRELERMQADSAFEDAVLHGIDFTDIGGGAAAEEAFQTHLIQNNPVLRHTVGRGERGYTVYLDKLRLSTYKKGAQRLERTAAKHGWDAERLDLAKKDWAGFVNHASGRGDLGGLNRYVPTFNALFFSPRFVASRPQTIYDLVKSDPAVRQMVGENLGAFVGSGVLLLTAAAASGARVELDPRSSDFGKVRIGDQRIEFWGGFQPLARYIAQVSTGDRKTLDSGETVGVNRWKTVGRFIRSKLSPGGALGWDLVVEGGRNYEGENFLKKDAIPSELMNRLMPLVLQDAIEGYRSQGVGAALTGAAISTVGGGVGTFAPNEREQKDAAKSKVQESLQKAGVPFSGDKIDFATPLLSYGRNRPRLAGILKMEAKEGESISAMRARYIAEKLDAYMESSNLSEPRAKDALGDHFDQISIVTDIRKRAREDELAYWKAHPADLKAALDAGLVEPSDAKDKIVAGR